MYVGYFAKGALGETPFANTYIYNIYKIII